MQSNSIENNHNQNQNTKKYKYSQKIQCLTCGKTFRGKMARKHKIYICSGRNNYGDNFCKNNSQIKEEYLDFIIERHQKDREVYVIFIDNNSIMIKYVDNSYSIIDAYNIIF